VIVDPIRLTAWQALSQLFLDTELDDSDISSISRQLRSTGYGLAELDRIYEEEVAPVCCRNLRALPGGAWTGFDSEWLAKAIDLWRRSEGLLHRIPWVKRLRIQRWTALSRADWERVKQSLIKSGSL
jgi:hypothetical protein